MARGPTKNQVTAQRYEDCPPCVECGDGYCDPNYENNTTCSIDCGGWCGDGICNGGETATYCRSDCGWCGDGVCYGSETINSCRNDCGWCGDGVCYGSETINSCSTDCAFRYSGAHINDWGSCDSSCSTAGSLSYTDDQINGFDSRMAAHGHIRMHRFSNTSVWASDYTEDGLGGQDNLYSDDSDLVAFSGHGSAFASSTGQAFSAPMCKQGSASSCRYYSANSRFGERAGTYASPNPGRTRWLMWLTCYSVDTAPHEQWGAALWQGLEYVMGYRGTSADSSTTDEVPGDWVDEAIGGSRGFKSAWFWAIEDWWVNDTGAVLSTGPDAATSSSRRDNLNKNWGRRGADDYGYWASWSWHEG
jgi:hypothetical protein